MTRFKSLIRFKALSDELRLRQRQHAGIGSGNPSRAASGASLEEEPGHVFAGRKPPNHRKSHVAGAQWCCRDHCDRDPQAGLFEAADKPYEW